MKEAEKLKKDGYPEAGQALKKYVEEGGTPKDKKAFYDAHFMFSEASEQVMLKEEWEREQKLLGNLIDLTEEDDE